MNSTLPISTGSVFMKTLALLMTLLIACAVFASDQREADIDRLQTSGVILDQIMSAPDRKIPDSIMDGAKCIAIVPSMLKASFIFGANYGKGVATCRTATGWSAPVFFKVEGGSFGFQAGGQASDLVLIIRTEDGMRYLLSSKFKLGADASAAAGPVGRDAQASTDLTMRAQILTYSRARGLFAGVSVSGAAVHQADGDTQAFYRAPVTYRQILGGHVAAPEEAQSFLKTVEKYAPTPRANVAATAPATGTTEPTTATSATASTAAAASSASETNAASTSTAATDATNSATSAANSADSASSATPTPNSFDDLSGMMMAPESQPAQAQPAKNAAPAQSPAAAPYSSSKPTTNEAPPPPIPPTGKGGQ
jgi:lipid-binding SYLF domain-containing protein